MGKENKIKLLFYTELWANAGIESVIMNLFRNFDKNLISVDIMASQNLTDFYDQEILRLGGQKYVTLQKNYSSPAKRMAHNLNSFKAKLEENRYDVVHLHMCNAASMVYGYIAKKTGVKVVVYHSHNTNISTNHRRIKTCVHNFCKLLFERYGDVYMSCSDLASKWMFRKKTLKDVILIKNAIDIDKFEFNQSVRDSVRQELRVDSKFVVGHIGRFAEAKNHSFLIDIFHEILRRNEESVLLLIGEGEDFDIVKTKVESLGLNDSVIFYGTTNKIPQLLWAMDAFVLPSFFEGNPVVGIEAQAASLSCFFADTITKMCQLTDNVCYLSLEDTPQKWAETIMSKSNKKRLPVNDLFRNAGYDIKEVAKEVYTIYIKVLNKR